MNQETEEKVITVEKRIWVRDIEKYYFFDEYLLTYSSVKKIKTNLYMFELTEIKKLNDQQFTGGGGYIVNFLPRLKHKVKLRRHSDKWGAKQWSRVVKWFNVEKAHVDEDYVQIPVELYPEKSIDNQ